MGKRRPLPGLLACALAAAVVLALALGAAPADLLYPAPLLAAGWATRLGIIAARRRPERRLAWSGFAASCASAMAASLVAAATTAAGGGPRAGLYVGGVSSLCMLAGTLAMVADARRAKGWPAMIDPLLLAGLAGSVLVDLLVVPGFQRGDGLLTSVLAIDVCALMCAAAAAAGPAPVAVKGWLLAVVTIVCLGDGAAAAGPAGIRFLPASATPLLWCLSLAFFAWAASRDLEAPPEREADREPSRRAAYIQTLLPLGAIVGYPVVVGILILAHGDWLDQVGFFGPLFLATTAVAFARQGVLLVEHRRAAIRERRLSADALRRNRELEALTGLASTVTEVLEEEPVIERGLEALRVAARTSSAALHLLRHGELRLVTATGDWREDSEGIATPDAPPEGVDLAVRTGRRYLRAPLVARDRTLGMLTLVRPEAEGPFDSELGLLGLLADQLAVALQNARDYRDKLEASTRDPLTGLYNRRYFYEAFNREVARYERHHTEAALVLFDIDDFKAINDTLGHQYGDEVLAEVGRVVSALTRPTDTFARIGGEEFGLLLPDTGQLDALLVAERLRTALARRRILGDRPVTMSGGVAALPQDGATPEDLQRRADEALYWAKRNGKNMCAVASEAISADTSTVQVGMLAHLHGVVAGIDAAQLHTSDHSENVASYAVAIGQALGLERDRIVRVRRAAFLHDIGKVAVPEEILTKPSALTDAEFEAIKVHPQVGETILHHAGLHEEARWVGAHHERLDGAGYPHGRSGEDIPLEARILFVADSFEAMTSDRPYRRGMPVAEAVAELRRCEGTQFDPAVVAALAGLIAGDRLAVLALRDPA